MSVCVLGSSRGAHRHRALDQAAQADGYRVTLLSFLLKASVAALKQFPELNSSLSPDKDSLILKGYYHMRSTHLTGWSCR